MAAASQAIQRLSFSLPNTKPLFLRINQWEIKKGLSLVAFRSNGLIPKASKESNFVTNAVAEKAEASTAAKSGGHEVLLYEALLEGLEEEMDRGPKVGVMDEDVGHYGGSYKVTKGLANKFGDLRVLDTPLLRIPSQIWELGQP